MYVSFRKDIGMDIFKHHYPVKHYFRLLQQLKLGPEKCLEKILVRIKNLPRVFNTIKSNKKSINHLKFFFLSDECWEGVQGRFCQRAICQTPKTNVIYWQVGATTDGYILRIL